MITVNFKG